MSLLPDYLSQAQQIAEALEGQCVKSLQDILEDRGIPDSQELREHLDEMVFQCETCDWWCSTDELINDDGDQECEDCAD